MELITLSVIIPNYNSGKLLEESLESIFFSENVTFTFEVLIMDNCSSDLPEEIIKKFPFENLLFFPEADSGIYYAMNKGIEKAKGDWVYFLGAGDLLFLHNLSEENFQSNLDFIYGLAYDKSKSLMAGYEMSLFDLLRGGICHQSIFYRSHLFEKFGKYSLDFPILSDYHFNLNIFFQKEINRKFFPILIAEYKGGGISSRVKDKKFNSKKLTIVFNFLLQNFRLYSLRETLRYFLFYFRNKIIFEINKRK